MPVMDEFREEREKMKNASPKEKWDYFWYYYKWYVIIGAAVIILTVSFIHDIITRKDTVFNVAIVNHYAETARSESYRNAFESYLGIDTEKEDTSFDNTYRLDFSSYSRETVNSSEKLVAQAASASLDLFVSDEDVFSQYAENSFFADLTTVLSKEELERYAPYLYYTEIENKKIPCGIYLGSCKEFLDTYIPITSSQSVLGVFANAPHTDYVLKFIEFTLGSELP